MVQSEIVNRVFRIKYMGYAGTCFTLEHNGSQFIVTAKHLFQYANYPSTADVEILDNKAYHTYNVEVHYPEDSYCDIAVMKIKSDILLSPQFGNKNTTEAMIYGQDVYFLGFPFDLDSDLGLIPNTSIPMPFVKKACLSGFMGDKILLDGHNNPGFSGGPVCYKPSNSITMNVAGVISGYRYAKNNVISNNAETNDYVKENTGIIYAYDIKCAINVIQEW